MSKAPKRFKKKRLHVTQFTAVLSGNASFQTLKLFPVSEFMGHIHYVN
jgi:hypothetical protein